MIYLLSIGKLVNGGINALLENTNFLILLLADSINLGLSVVEFSKQVVDLQLLGLQNIQNIRIKHLSQKLRSVLPSKNPQAQSADDYTL